MSDNGQAKLSSRSQSTHVPRHPDVSAGAPLSRRRPTSAGAKHPARHGRGCDTASTVASASQRPTVLFDCEPNKKVAHVRAPRHRTATGPKVAVPRPSASYVPPLRHGTPAPGGSAADNSICQPGQVEGEPHPSKAQLGRMRSSSKLLSIDSSKTDPSPGPLPSDPAPCRALARWASEGPRRRVTAAPSDAKLNALGGAQHCSGDELPQGRRHSAESSQPWGSHRDAHTAGGKADEARRCSDRTATVASCPALGMMGFGAVGDPPEPITHAADAEASKPSPSQCPNREGPSAAAKGKVALGRLKSKLVEGQLREAAYRLLARIRGRKLQAQAGSDRAKEVASLKRQIESLQAVRVSAFATIRQQRAELSEQKERIQWLESDSKDLDKLKKELVGLLEVFKGVEAQQAEDRRTITEQEQVLQSSEIRAAALELEITNLRAALNPQPAAPGSIMSSTSCCGSSVSKSLAVSHGPEQEASNRPAEVSEDDPPLTPARDTDRPSLEVTGVGQPPSGPAQMPLVMAYDNSLFGSSAASSPRSSASPHAIHRLQPQLPLSPLLKPSALRKGTAAPALCHLEATVSAAQEATGQDEANLDTMVEGRGLPIVAEEKVHPLLSWLPWVN